MCEITVLFYKIHKNDYLCNIKLACNFVVYYLITLKLAIQTEIALIKIAIKKKEEN